MDDRPGSMRTRGLKDDTTCIVVDIIPPDTAMQPPSPPHRKPSKFSLDLYFSGRRPMVPQVNCLRNEYLNILGCNNCSFFSLLASFQSQLCFNPIKNDYLKLSQSSIDSYTIYHGYIVDWGMMRRVVHQHRVFSCVLYVKQTQGQVKGYRFMLVPYFQQAQNLGKVLSFALIVVIRKMPWRENDQMESKSLNTRNYFPRLTLNRF